MHRPVLLVLALLAAAPAWPQEEAPRKVIAEFRLRKDTTTMRGWVVDQDQQGFRFEHLGGAGRRRILWDDLVPEDARALRIQFGLEMTEDEKKGLIEGHEITFRGGGSVRGIVVATEEDGTVRVRQNGLVLPYPADRVERVDARKIQEEEAYSAEEIYIRRLERRPPETAEEHRRLADYLYDVGNWEDAEKEYAQAVAADPLLEAELAARRRDLVDFMQDRAAREVFQRAHRIAVLDGKWQEAIEGIRAYGEANPGARRRGFKVIEELEAKWLERKQALFHAVKNDELDRSIRSFLVRTQPDLAMARDWVTGELKDLILTKVTERLGLSAEEAEMFLKSRSRGSPHWATYGSGTFVIDRRAKTGKSTNRAVRGDPEGWWARFCDVSTRATWMKAYAAERLDIFEVVRVTTADCLACGGVGQVRKQSLTAVSGGQHEWNENCPRCFGARQERGVGYR